MFEVNVLDITNASVIFKKNASGVILPGEEGQMTVLDFHQSFVITLEKGIVKIDNLNIRVKSGIAAMKDNKLSMLIEKI